MKSLLLLSLVLLAGCGSASEDPAVNVDSTAAPASVEHPPPVSAWDSIRATAPPIDPCEVARHVTISLDSIRRWPLRISREADPQDTSEDCRFVILDSLVEGFVRTGDDDYVAALDSLSQWSDTFFAEAFGDVVERLIERRGPDFVAYLAAHRAGPSPLEAELVERWMQDGSATDTAEGKTWVLSRVRASVPDTALAADARSHLETMLRRAGVQQ
jgi:hypothetical protein